MNETTRKALYVIAPLPMLLGEAAIELGKAGYNAGTSAANKAAGLFRKDKVEAPVDQPAKIDQAQVA